VRGSPASLPLSPSARQWVNLVEGHVEEIVQHESQALGGRKCVQDDQQRLADRVGQLHFFLRVDPVLLVNARFRSNQSDGLLTARFARAQHVQADPRNHGRQPCAQIPDPDLVGTAEVEPALLYGILRFGARAEHAVGDCPQVGTFSLKLCGQPVVFLHSSSSLSLIGHTSSVCSVNKVTGETSPM
jgi:hypothetical protein